jgi:hypothetical protein
MFKPWEIKKGSNCLKPFVGLVGVAGFEPTTFCSQSRRDTGLRYTPKINNLTDHSLNLNLNLNLNLKCGEGGIRTLDTLLEYAGLANRYFRPLSHLTFCLCKGVQK